MKTALFVDFDNVYSGLRRISTQGADRLARQPAKWLRWLTDNLPVPGADADTPVNRRVLVRRCYLNPVMFNQFRRPFHEAGFEIVDCPPTTASGKTSTDIHLVLDTIDALQDATHFDEFVVFSADADFSPLLRRLRRHDRRTIIFAAGAMSESYKAAADAVIDIPTFLREALQLVEEEPELETDQGFDAGTQAPRLGELRKKAEASIRRLVLEAADPLALPRLAQLLQRELPGLKDAQWAGAGSFGALLRQLSPAGVVFDFKDDLAFDQVRRDKASARPANASPPPLLLTTPEGATTPASAAGAQQAAATPSGEPLDDAAVRLIRQWMAAAQRPLHFSTLGTELRKALAPLADGWSGAPTLAAYLQRLPLEPLMRGTLEDGSTFVLYDPERHQAPAGVVGDTLVSAMLRAAELPAIRAQDFAITATAIVAAVGDAKAFKNGRHLAAWIGLVPRQHSSGGKNRLLGISKRGDSYLRTLLIHGARSVLIHVACKPDARSRWLQELIARHGYNRATVALANKNARVIKAMLSHETKYWPAMVAM